MTRLHVACREREIIEMFSRVHEEIAPIISDTLLLVTILIGQNRGRIERTIGLIIDQSEMCSLAGVMVAPTMEEEEID